MIFFQTVAALSQANPMSKPPVLQQLLKYLEEEKQRAYLANQCYTKFSTYQISRQVGIPVHECHQLIEEYLWSLNWFQPHKVQDNHWMIITLPFDLSTMPTYAANGIDLTAVEQDLFWATERINLRRALMDEIAAQETVANNIKTAQKAEESDWQAEQEANSVPEAEIDLESNLSFRNSPCSLFTICEEQEEIIV